MNKSKLESFKDSEISLTLNSATLTRGGQDETWQTCIEQTGIATAPDATVEKWPDNGGAVQTFTYRHLPYLP